MEAALNQVRASSGRCEDDDVRRLSPLIHGHLNFLGRYHFSLPSDVRDGELRGLRDPSAGLEEDLLPPEAAARVSDALRLERPQRRQRMSDLSCPFCKEGGFDEIGVESGRGRNPTLSAGHRFLGHRYSPVRRI